MGANVGKSGGTFLDSLPSQGTMHVVMLGLDSAGKTTALYRLKFDQYLNTVPTIGFNCEKVQGTVGRAKGVQFLVWDVGGQEKLRPLWRSYTRCTDGILFVVDSVDVERMEEAKMELMRTAKCPDNQGVPVLILANKQDLPGAREPKELEKLLGLHELQYPAINLMSTTNSTSSSTGNIVGCTKSSTSSRSILTSQQHNKLYGYNEGISSSTITKDAKTHYPLVSSISIGVSSTSLLEQHSSSGNSQESSTSFRHSNSKEIRYESIPSSVATTPTSVPTNSLLTRKSNIQNQSATNPHQYKGWYIQPACAITGEGLQEGLEALYEMILKRRKLNKTNRKKR